MISLSSALVLAVLGYAVATPLDIEHRSLVPRAPNGKFKFPKTYAAFGDSYSAGIGAGQFLSTSPDGRDSPCGRTDGAHPHVLTPLLKIFGWKDFYSCSGDKLGDMNLQYANFKSVDANRKVDFATLSISGNDFNFGQVVASCVYAPSWPWHWNYQTACNEAMDEAQKKLDNPENWQKYRDNVNHIQKEIVNSDGRLYITGYPKFFAEDGFKGDVCDNRYFYDDNVWGTNLKMLLDNRNRINTAIDKANKLIQDNVVSQSNSDASLPPVVFIDTDKPFVDTHRFCEHGLGKNVQGIDPNTDDVFYIDLFTPVIADETNWEPVKRAAEDQIWAGNMTAGDGDGLIKLPSKYQTYSTFHPKKRANTAIAARIAWNVYHTTSQDKTNCNDPDCSPEIKEGPQRFCMGFSPGGGDSCADIPANCAIIAPIDNTSPTVVCEDGRSFNVFSPPKDV